MASIQEQEAHMAASSQQDKAVAKLLLAQATR